MIAAIVLLVMTLPSGAFTATDISRAGTFGAVSDSNADLGLVVNSSVQNCARQSLVDVTNGFPQAVDVTVTLDDPSVGTLYTTVNGDSGSSVTMALSSGGSGGVELDASYTGALPTTVTFDVEAAGTGLTVLAPRSTTLDGNCPPVGDFTMTRGKGNKLDVDGSPSSDQDGSIVSYEWYVNDPTASGQPDATGQTATLKPVKTGDTVTLVVTDDDGATDLVSKTAP
ncbi:MAG: PKD domain-containing protein [Halobacteriales archaeon]|nr:PKD domain-containing protein [Halobacteriales archaeon]